MTLNFFDGIMLLLIILVVIKVTITGFITEFFSKAAVIAGAIGAILFYQKLSPYFMTLVGPERFPGVISFLSIFLSIYLLVKLIQLLIGSAFEGETMTNLDRSLGFFLGIAEGILLVCIILISIQKQPWFELSWMIQDSVCAAVLGPFLADGQGFVLDFLQ